MTIHSQLLNEINKRSAGEYLPSESKLAERFGVSRGAVRNVLQEFWRLGKIGSKPAKGWFVCNQEQATQPALEINVLEYSLGEQLRQNGRQSTNVVLKGPETGALDYHQFSEGRVTEKEVVNALEVRGDDLLWFERLRLADNVPIALEYSVFRRDSFAVMPTKSQLEKAGGLSNFLQVSSQKMSSLGFATVAVPHEEEALKLTQGSAILCVKTKTDMTLDSGRQISEWTVTLYTTLIAIRFEKQKNC